MTCCDGYCSKSLWAWIGWGVGVLLGLSIVQWMRKDPESFINYFFVGEETE